MPKKAVDFSDPESIAEELAGAAIATPTVKAPKVAKPKVIKVTFTADRDIAAGEEISFDYTIQKSDVVRGIVAGIALDKMTVDQLKIEYRNASSVAYKTKKAGHDTTKADARLAACKAEMEKRGVQPNVRSTSGPVDASAIANLIKTGAISIEDIQKFLDGATEALEPAVEAASAE